MARSKMPERAYLNSRLTTKAQAKGAEDGGVFDNINSTADLVDKFSAKDSWASLGIKDPGIKYKEPYGIPKQKGDAKDFRHWEREDFLEGSRPPEGWKNQATKEEEANDLMSLCLVLPFEPFKLYSFITKVNGILEQGSDGRGAFEQLKINMTEHSEFIREQNDKLFLLLEDLL